MKIVICNQKGGTGKTVTAILLAYALGAAGKSVGLLDRDPQQTATRCLENAPGENVEIHRVGGDYDVEIIDTAGYAGNPGVAQSLKEADKIIVVSSTSPHDVWSTQDAVAMIREKRPDIRPVLLFTRFRPNTEFGKTRDAVAKALGLRAFKNAIPERTSIQRSAVQGFAALPPIERENIARLAIEVLTIKP